MCFRTVLHPLSVPTHVSAGRGSVLQNCAAPTLCSHPRFCRPRQCASELCCTHPLFPLTFLQAVALCFRTVLHPPSVPITFLQAAAVCFSNAGRPRNAALLWADVGLWVLSKGHVRLAHRMLENLCMTAAVEQWWVGALKWLCSCQCFGSMRAAK